jgi:kynurenine formamidase
MKAQIDISKKEAMLVDLDRPIPISIPIKNGNKNPNCYWADQVKFEIIKTEGFVGSVAEGGSVNYQKLQITPHGNGTHTEGFGHITATGETINTQLKSYHFYTKLISLTPKVSENGDLILGLDKNLIKEDWSDIKALIIRTLPNNDRKLSRQYSGTNPPYVSPSLIEFIVNKKIEHLLIDLPSIDKEVDGGALISHNAFWNISEQERNNATITELIYVPNSVPDANYLLNLQILNLEMDATPCNPTLYEIEELISISR